MAGSSGFSNLLGTLSSIFRIGLNGPAWKSNASKLLASSNDGTSLVNVQVLTPVDAFDAANKGYVDNVEALLVSQTREIVTTEGIQGGGLLDNDLELKLDVNGLANLAVVDSAADSVLVYDASASVHKKALISSLPGGTEAADIAAETAARIAADAALADDIAELALAVSVNLPSLTPSVTVIDATDTVASGQWSSSVPVVFGATYSGCIETILFLGNKNTGIVLTDCFGKVSIFNSDPGLVAGTVSSLSAVQEDMLLGEATFANASLATDANTFRVTMLTQIEFPPLTELFVAFWSLGATSFSADEIAKIRLGIKRYS